MQEQPHPVGLVDGDLDEVVAAAQRAELRLPPLLVPRRVEPGLLGEVRELLDPRHGGRHDLPVVVPGPERDRPLDRLPQRRERPLRPQLPDVELRPHRRHPAADVHAHGRRHDRPQGRDHRPDGRAPAEVRVGHQRDVRVDERHRRGPLGLLPRARVEDRRPVDQTPADLLHCAVSSPRLGCRRTGRDASQEERCGAACFQATPSSADMAAVASSSAAVTSRRTSSDAARSGRARATTSGRESPVVSTGAATEAMPGMTPPEVRA